MTCCRWWTTQSPEYHRKNYSSEWHEQRLLRLNLPREVVVADFQSLVAYVIECEWQKCVCDDGSAPCRWVVDSRIGPWIAKCGSMTQTESVRTVVKVKSRRIGENYHWIWRWNRRQASRGLPAHRIRSESDYQLMNRRRDSILIALSFIIHISTE